MDRSVFISYSHNDRSAVRRDADLLRASGVQVFIDVSDIAFGERWRDVLRQALLQCERMLVFWSRSALGSEWVDREWRFALSLGKKIVPTLLDTTPLPAELAEFQAVRRYRRAPRQPPQPSAAGPAFGSVPAPLEAAARPVAGAAPAPLPPSTTARPPERTAAAPPRATSAPRPLVVVGAAALVVAAGAGWWLLDGSDSAAPPVSSPAPPPPTAASPSPPPTPIATSPRPSITPAPVPPAPGPVAPTDDKTGFSWAPPLLMLLLMATAVWIASRRRQQRAPGEARPAAEVGTPQASPSAPAAPEFAHTDAGMPIPTAADPLDAGFADRDFVRAVFAA